MLGDIVQEDQGKMISFRVLPDGKIEQTIMAQGLFLGDESSATRTIEVELRPDRTGYGEFRGFFTTKSGAMGQFKGMGNGESRPDGTMSWRGVVCHSNPPGKYARFNGIVLVWETEVDREGNIFTKSWEWK